MKNFKVFKSSAGSGKTFTLVREYLKLALIQPDDFRSILAITFTNKAAEEMKSRIIEALVELSGEGETELLYMIQDDLPGVPVKKNAERCLKNILHDYSAFAVSTIDSFFHRILRSLAREINLPVNLEVQIDSEEAILEVTNELLKEVGVDQELTDWLTNLAMQKMDDDKGWSIESDIRTVAEEILKEKGKDERTIGRDDIHRFYNEMVVIRRQFQLKMSAIGQNAITVMKDQHLELEDFAYSKSGLVNYFFRISDKYNPDYNPGKRVNEGLTNIDTWVAKKHKQRNHILSIAEDKLLPLLKEAVDYFNEKGREYYTAVEVLKKIYLFGIVNDLKKKFSEYRKENNTILISDTTRLLGEIIEGSDAPFIYEKAGNRYKHLLIDEFQDTSILQWTNLLPLIVNALGSGYVTLIVGDAKQSIYRWRGGNMNLLLRNILTDLKTFEELFDSKVLETNYRSKKEIIHFNNTFFEKVVQVLNQAQAIDEKATISLAYGRDLKQKVAAKNNEGGYVSVEFLENNQPGETDESDDSPSAWKEKARLAMLDKINQLLNSGYTFRDICILVRGNKEGNELANFLLENGIENILSPDSLLISASPRILFMINLFRYIADTSNAIAKSEIIYYYSLFLKKDVSQDLHQIFSDHKFGNRKKLKDIDGGLFGGDGFKNDLFCKIMPAAFTSDIKALSRLPVYELSERLINIFELNDLPDAYVQRFQDLVLEFSNRTESGLDCFLEWWDTSSKVKNCSVSLPSNENAIRIMTIHKSKGLQFPVVLMPYCEWSIKPKSKELLWMTASEKPFSELGKMAVVGSDALLKTSFEEDYRRELEETLIDNTNLLYVAFTRAEHQLFIWTAIDSGKELNKVSKLLFRTLTDMSASFTDRFEQGSQEGKIHGKGDEDFQVSEKLRCYPSHPWNKKLKLKTQGTDMIEAVTERSQKLNYGKLMHQLLSEIRTSEEIPQALERLLFSGIITREEQEELGKTVTELLAIPDIAVFFDGDSKTISEKDLILPGGALLRPDRVLINDQKVRIVDFKTGKREKKHHDQVRSYAEVIRNMGYSSVESYLLYLSDKMVEKVD